MTIADTAWTREELERAQDLWISGQSAKQISSVVNRSRSAIIGKMKRLGLLGSSRGLTPKKASPRPRAKSKIPTAPMVLPKVEAPATASLNPVLLEALLPHHCRAILGDVGQDGFALYCGDPKAEGSSYCTFHHGLYTQLPAPRKHYGETRQRF